MLTRANHTWQLIAIGGADYFEQDNDFVSPRELQYEPNDGQPGTAVLSKSSNRNLNLAVNSNWTYVPTSGSYPVHLLGRRAVRGPAAQRHPDPRP